MNRTFFILPTLISSLGLVERTVAYANKIVIPNEVRDPWHRPIKGPSLRSG
jgi:hypothetical protein